VETVAASWDHAAAEEQRFARLQPRLEVVALFRHAGILPENEGLVWPSEPAHVEAGISAPDWTRTSTPSRAQALNLLRIPIPPQGL
jgi:hypothetical protein